MNDNVQEKNAALKAAKKMQEASDALAHWMLLASWMKKERDHQAVCLRTDMREYAGFLENKYKKEGE